MRLTPSLVQFPPPKGGGSIEGVAAWFVNIGMSRFPPPKGGGSIEGPLRKSKSWSPRANFHRRKGVAPLKDGRHPHVHYLDSDFHRRKGVAPLKVTQGCSSNGRSIYFHRRKGVAPLKDARQGPSHWQRHYFHRRKGVAPLKVWRRDNNRCDFCKFPPPKGGCSIEGI